MALKLQEKSDALLDHSRVTHEKLNVQKTTMKNIQYDMTQANKDVT